MANSSGFVLDILSDDEIIDFADYFLDVKISSDDLKSPKPDVVRGIYVGFLFNLANVKYGENVLEPPFQAMNCLDYQEIYYPILPDIILTQRMKKLLEPIGIPDFYLQDIVTPRPKRFKKVVTHLINFARFYMVRYGVWQEIKEKCAKEAEEREQLRSSNDQLRRQINEAKVYLMNNQGKYKEDEEKLKLLQSEVDDKQRESSQLKELHSKKKQELCEKQSQLEQLSVDIATTKEKCDDLNQKVVKSPQQTVEKLNQKNNNLAEIMQQSSDLASQLLSAKRMITTANTISDELTKANVLASETLSHGQKLREKKMEKDQLEEQFRKLKNELQIVEKNLKLKKQHLQSKNELILKEKMAYKRMLEDLVKRNEDLKGFIGQQKNSQSAFVEKIKGLKVQENALLQEIKDLEEERENITKKFDENTELLMKKMHTFELEMNADFEKTTKKLHEGD